MTDTDPMTLLRQADRLVDTDLSGVDRAALAALREGIIMTTTTTAPAPGATTPAPKPNTRRRRRGLAALATAGLLAGAGGVAYALWPDHAETSSLQCVASDGDTMIAPVSGDPVADCVAAWTTQGVPVPKDPTAWRVGAFAIVVGASTDMPANATPITATDQDTTVIELAASLDDIVERPAGLHDCATKSDVRQYAQAQLTRLGLTGWSVTDGDGAGDCYAAFADAASRTITVIGGPDDTANLPTDEPATDPEGNPYPTDADMQAFRTALRTGITESCVSTATAKKAVLDAAAVHHLGFVKPTIHPDAAADCARVDAVAGGGVDVRIYGK